MKFSKTSHQLLVEASKIIKEKGFIEEYLNISGLLFAISRGEQNNLETFKEYIIEAASKESDVIVEEEDIEDSIKEVMQMEDDYPGLRDLKISIKSLLTGTKTEVFQYKDKKEISEDKKDESDTKNDENVENLKESSKMNCKKTVAIPIAFVKDETNPNKTNMEINLEQISDIALAIEQSKVEAKAKKVKDDATKKKQKEEEIKTIEKIKYHYYDTDGTEHEIILSANMEKVWTNFIIFEEDYGINIIEPTHIISALFYKEIDQVKEFFVDLEVSYYKAKKYFDIDVIKSLESIPKDLEGFLSIMNHEVNINKPCEILKRDKETDTLINILMKKNKRNAVIIGEAGVGKTALIERLAYLIESKNCPEVFYGLKVVLLDVNALIAGTSFRGDAEKRIESLIRFLKKNQDVILFIDEVHTILGAGSCYEGEMDLANALKPILARGDTRVIGATTEAEYDKYFSKDAALQRRFEKVEVEEPSAEDVFEMVKNKIKVLSDYHDVKISKTMVDHTILIANCFAFNKKNPDKTLDLIDRAMVVAKRNGSKTVKKEHVRKNFAIFDELWDNMPIEEKTRIAYHETGHYVTCKYSGRLIQEILIAVSILPAEEYLGVTVFETSKKQVPHTSRQYFIDVIAMNLAGRVAEEFLKEDEYTSGASQDLKVATEIARTVIAEYGMGEKIGVNRIYSNSCNQPMFSDKIIEEVNSEIDKLIEAGMIRAKEILTENKDIFMAIQKALLKKHILSEKELDNICQRKIAARTKNKADDSIDV